LDIAYDEIAESLSRKTSTISAQKIIIEDTNYVEMDATQTTSIYKIEDNGMFLPLRN